MLLIGILGLAIAVHARALGTYFAQDDITFLLRAALHLPHPGLTRLLSAGLGISAEHAVFGLTPIGYHAVNLALHGLNTFGVHALSLRWSRDPRAAALAAILFGTSSIAFTPLHWVTGIVELLTTTCLLGATLLHFRPGTPGIPGILATALLVLAALLSKESAIPWVATMLVADGLCGRVGSHSRALIPAGVLTGAFAAWLFLAGTGLDSARGGAYSMTFSPAFLGANLATYAAWSLTPWHPIPDLVAAADFGAWRVAVPLALALAFIVARLPAPGRFPVYIGIAWWLAFLVPVLPLQHHTFHYYLYVPWVGGSIALASATSRLAERFGARPAAIACVIVGAISVLLQWRNVSLRSSVLDDHLPADRTLRESLLIRHAVQSLNTAKLPAGTPVGFVNPIPRERATPPAGRRSLNERSDTTRSYIPLEGALRGGETLALLVPQVRYRGFSTTIPPDWPDVECFYYEQRGWLEPWGKGREALLNQARIQLRAGRTLAAESTLRRVRVIGGSMPTLSPPSE